MKDLSQIEATSEAIAAAKAIIEANTTKRNKLLSDARKDGYAWPRLEAAARLSRQATVDAAIRGNKGVLPKPRQQEA